jgi:transposase
MARRTARQWSRLVARWKRSGLSAREFGVKARVDYRSLHWWSWALGKREVQKNERTTLIEDAPAFLPVHIAQHDARSEQRSAGLGEPIEIVVDGRLAVRVGPGFDEDTLMRVLDLLCHTRGA